MSNKQNRRTFLKAGALFSVGALLETNISKVFAQDSHRSSSTGVDLSIVRGDNYYANTFKAVEALGGMKKFITKNSTVGLLVNSRYNKPGTYVKPEIALAVINMCFSAGAKRIVSLENVSGSYWKLSNESKKHSDSINEIANAGSNYTKVKIPGGVSLKEAEVERAFLDCDVYVNVPIFKQHEGIRITGCLKNPMGLTSYNTNRFFHFGSNATGWYDDVTFLSQCITDINLVRKPDLCVADATEYITTNGPFGPGNVAKAKKIVAGTDLVAVDVMGANILGYEAKDILPITLAHKHGLGEIDLAKAVMKEIEA